MFIFLFWNITWLAIHTSTSRAHYILFYCWMESVLAIFTGGTISTV